MNEIEFVSLLKKHFPFSRGTGIGDDTSVTSSNNGKQLITTDILIENIHFRSGDFSLDELALRAIAVNLSDIAAMGGEAQYFYLGLGFPNRLTREDLNTFLRGLKKGCRRWNLEMAGGDFSRSPVLFISITMVGSGKHPVFRHTAREGDLIGINGTTGESALGLELLLRGKKETYWINKHKIVDPQLRDGQIFSQYVNSMIDISDGLILDLKRILRASGKGARIQYEKIPVQPKFKRVCRKYSIDEYPLILAGGEDYILLFTVSRENESKMKRKGLSYHIIGEINSRKNELVVSDQGRILKSDRCGYDHFETPYNIDNTG